MGNNQTWAWRSTDHAMARDDTHDGTEPLHCPPSGRALLLRRVVRAFRRVPQDRLQVAGTVRGERAGRVAGPTPHAPHLAAAHRSCGRAGAALRAPGTSHVGTQEAAG